MIHKQMNEYMGDVSKKDELIKKEIREDEKEGVCAYLSISRRRTSSSSIRSC